LIEYEIGKYMDPGRRNRTALDLKHNSCAPTFALPRRYFGKLQLREEILGFRIPVFEHPASKTILVMGEGAILHILILSCSALKSLPWVAQANAIAKNDMADSNPLAALVRFAF